MINETVETCNRIKRVLSLHETNILTKYQINNILEYVKYADSGIDNLNDITLDFDYEDFLSK